MPHFAEFMTLMATQAAGSVLADGLGVPHRACPPAQQTAQFDTVRNTAVPDTARTAAVDGDGRLRGGRGRGHRRQEGTAPVIGSTTASTRVVDVTHGHAGTPLSAIRPTGLLHKPVAGIGSVHSPYGPSRSISGNPKRLKYTSSISRRSR